MEWVFVSCDTEHNPSADRVKFGQITQKARSSPAVCRCKQMHLFVLYHDIKRASDRMAAHRKTDRRRICLCGNGLHKCASRCRFILCSEVNGRIYSRYVSAVKKNSCFLEQQFLQSKRQRRQSRKTIVKLSKA